MNRKVSHIFLLWIVVSIIAGCSMFGDDEKSSSSGGQVKRVESKAGGPDKGLLNSLFGLNEQPGIGGAPSGAGISVNGYLWRATLDTISFMPLAQADPFGGIILTDWYSPPDTEKERFKVNVYILDSELRADGLRVSVFRQRRDANGVWVNAEVSTDTGTNLENAILKRARQMRVTRQ
jgi:hypothetical protein